MKPKLKYIIATGNPVDGFRYYGPFKERDDAFDWADKHSMKLAKDWWLVELEAP